MSPLWRLLYRFYRLFSWLRHWVTRRFAPAGLAALAGLMVIAMLASDTENTVAYQGFALLLVLIGLAVSFSLFFNLRFTATRRLPRFGTVGKPFRYRVALKNLAATTQRGLSVLENLADPRPSLADWRAAQLEDERRVRSFRFSRRRGSPFKAPSVKEAAVPALPPNEEVDVELELTPLRRGVLRFTGVTLARPDPFGLFRAFARATVAQSVLILPRRYDIPPVALPGSMKFQQGGVALASSVGQSDEFVALRDYRRGDPLRHIHWRTWARAGKPIVKEFQDEFFVRHALVLDTFTTQTHSEAFEEAVSVASSFACTLQTQESLLDLLFVGSQAYCFTSGRGLAHGDQMLEILASVRPCMDQSFEALEHLALGHIGLVSGCVCVLLSWDEPRRNFVQKIKRLGVPVLVLVLVEPGHGKSLDPGPLRDEPERFRVLELGRIEAGLAEVR